MASRLRLRFCPPSPAGGSERSRAGGVPLRATHAFRLHIQRSHTRGTPPATLRDMARTPARTIERVQDGLLRLLGNEVEARGPLVAAMLRRDAREATSYWLQLVVSVGIATLGLVLGSTAVIIGAMLVAPLMGPIVGLAMGLATGSPFLVLRSGGRIGFSIVVVVGGAAGITRLLPFHALTAELSARSSPTALDLATAAFCAVAGVYATLRPGSETATTAAGTSIGISLVPPLCASGYGVGTGAWSVTVGAGLLFLANLVAIVVVGTVAFLGAGFNRVDVAPLEHEELAHDVGGAPLSWALARRLERLFATRLGPALRFLMPLLLLGAVYLPLRRALDEVAWEVRTRGAVREALARQSARIIQSRVRVERHEVEVVIVLVGKTHDAEAARQRLDREIRGAAGVAPRLEILAVPDATAFAGLETTLLTPHAVEPVRAAPPPTLSEQLDASRARLRGIVQRLWPASVAGAPAAIEVGVAGEEALPVRVVHLGAPLGADAREALERAVQAELDRPVRIADDAIPPSTLTREQGDTEFVARVALAVSAAVRTPTIRACTVRPAPPLPGRGAPPGEVALGQVLDGLLARLAQVTVIPGESWSVRFTGGECVATADARDAGATDADAGP